jgi:hypothetical protein
MQTIRYDVDFSRPDSQAAMPNQLFQADYEKRVGAALGIDQAADGSPAEVKFDFREKQKALRRILQADTRDRR